MNHGPHNEDRLRLSLKQQNFGQYLKSRPSVDQSSGQKKSTDYSSHFPKPPTNPSDGESFLYFIYPARSTTSPQPPQTPGRAAANRLLSRLNQQSQMVSPGPLTRGRGDDESDSDEDEPETPVRIPRRRLLPPISLHSDSEEESSLPSRPSRARARVTTAQPSGQGNQSVPQPSPESSELDPWNGYSIDGNKYAWAGYSVLTANTKTADRQAFFGEHIEHCGYKCSLCPQIYGSGGSLTSSSWLFLNKVAGFDRCLAPDQPDTFCLLMWGHGLDLVTAINLVVAPHVIADLISHNSAGHIALRKLPRVNRFDQDCLILGHVGVQDELIDAIVLQRGEFLVVGSAPSTAAELEKTVGIGQQTRLVGSFCLPNTTVPSVFDNSDYTNVLQAIKEFLDLMIFLRGKIIGELFFFVILGIRFGRRARNRGVEYITLRKSIKGNERQSQINCLPFDLLDGIFGDREGAGFDLHTALHFEVRPLEAKVLAAMCLRFNEHVGVTELKDAAVPAVSGGPHLDVALAEPVFLEVRNNTRWGDAFNFLPANIRLGVTSYSDPAFEKRPKLGVMDNGKMLSPRMKDVPPAQQDV
ncbi:hypothetical protein B0H13DRAFT_1865131 [Mycena leptocephala]|nr:hypothetical protein B0H13DRAFT_1865131 [Mycena leptocephala]